MNLVGYSSSDSDEFDEDENKQKRFKCESISTKTVCATNNDRKRLFPHERGNWALSIYAFIDCTSYMDTMIDDFIEIFNCENSFWKRLTEYHISLSKTFPIRYHHIESIRKCIQNELLISEINFTSRIENVTILTNDDGSTSFLVFTLDRNQYFSKLIEIIDKILIEHRYPCYYENPCFHISFAYSTIENRLEKLPIDWKEKCQLIFKQYQCQSSAINHRIDDIRLKAGNRVYYLTKPSMGLGFRFSNIAIRKRLSWFDFTVACVVGVLAGYYAFKPGLKHAKDAIERREALKEIQERRKLQVEQEFNSQSKQ